MEAPTSEGSQTNTTRRVGFSFSFGWSSKRDAPGAHLLSALGHRLGLTLGQQAVADKINEIGAIGDVLRALVLENGVITMDALLTQREVAQTIVDGGGDYLMIVKGNQPSLQDEMLFAALVQIGSQVEIGYHILWKIHRSFPISCMQLKFCTRAAYPRGLSSADRSAAGALREPRPLLRHRRTVDAADRCRSCPHAPAGQTGRRGRAVVIGRSGVALACAVGGSFGARRSATESG
ncbi:MAG: ISAs1 family transposase [Pyrinomonadaceae bacterium]|nr:ISAs1 family transposase [Pyrinomonadaceae bacterium]